MPIFHLNQEIGYMSQNLGFKRTLMEPTKKREIIHLSDYFKVVIKRKTLITAFLVMSVTLTMLFSYMNQPVYETSAKLLIEKEQTSSPLTGEKVDYSTYQSQLLTFNTHFKLIESKPVIVELIKELGLGRQRDKKEERPLTRAEIYFKKLKDTIKPYLRRKKEKLTPEKQQELLIKSVQRAISIKQIRDTRLLSISARSIDPQKATNLANTLAQKYIEFDMGNRLDSSTKNLEWMNNELFELKKRLEKDEEKFHEFKQMNKVFSIEGKQNVISQKIEEFNNEYLEARNRRLELEAKLDEISRISGKGSDITYIRSIISNPAIDSIYENLTRLELEATRLSKVFKAKHPKMVQNTSEIDKNRRKLQAEIDKELDNLSTERAVLLAREKVMDKSISEFEEDAVDASGKELRYTILQRNMTTSQNLYDTLLTKVKESGVMSNAADSNIRIVEMAAVPIFPVSPNKKKNLFLSIILGLFGGVGLAFFLEYLDQSIRTEEDVENYLELPVLSLIPIADVGDRKEAY